MNKTKEKSYTYSVRLPPAYEEVLNKGRKYLFEHPDLINKIGKIIFVSDVFRYALDLLADTLEIDFKVVESDLEFEDDTKQQQNEQATALVGILSSQDFNILEEYLRSDEGYSEKMSVFEFCELKGIDWRKLLRDKSQEL